MTMENREVRYYTTAGLANLLQIAICFFATFVGMFLNINSALLALILIIAEISVWAICGFRLSMSVRMSSPLKLIGAAFIALFPILFYTVLALILKGGEGESQNWTRFFFVGGPLIFFNRPVAMLVNLFKGDAYRLFFVNYGIMAVSYLAGGIFGYGLSAPAAKRKEIRQKKEKREEKKKARKKKSEKKKKNDDAPKDNEKADDKAVDYTDVSDSEMERIHAGQAINESDGDGKTGGE